VKDAMQTNFSKRGDLGASVSIVHQNETVVDLWGGYADESQSALWQQHSIVNVFSTTKTMAALCLLMLHDRGKLDLFQPVCRYWPEFAEQGKKDILIAHIMSHSAGLSGLDQQVTESDLYSQDKMAGNLQEQKPWWQPGQACGYHSVTQGFLQAELVRRVDGRTLGAFSSKKLRSRWKQSSLLGFQTSIWMLSSRYRQ
ncbi:MAG: serine hydrolase domain-containing protein, partial [Gammaproteobacteria bacterium]